MKEWHMVRPIRGIQKSTQCCVRLRHTSCLHPSTTRSIRSLGYWGIVARARNNGEVLIILRRAARVVWPTVDFVPSFCSLVRTHGKDEKRRTSIISLIMLLLPYPVPGRNNGSIKEDQCKAAIAYWKSYSSLSMMHNKYCPRVLVLKRLALVVYWEIQTNRVRLIAFTLFPRNQ